MLAQQESSGAYRPNSYFERHQLEIEDWIALRAKILSFFSGLMLLVALLAAIT
jgi:hypothetical protein